MKMMKLTYPNSTDLELA